MCTIRGLAYSLSDRGAFGCAAIFEAGVDRFSLDEAVFVPAGDPVARLDLVQDGMAHGGVAQELDHFVTLTPIQRAEYRKMIKRLCRAIIRWLERQTLR